MSQADAAEVLLVHPKEEKTIAARQTKLCSFSLEKELKKEIAAPLMCCTRNRGLWNKDLPSTNKLDLTAGWKRQFDAWKFHTQIMLAFLMISAPWFAIETVARPSATDKCRARKGDDETRPYVNGICEFAFEMEQLAQTNYFPVVITAGALFLANEFSRAVNDRYEINISCASAILRKSQIKIYCSWSSLAVHQSSTHKNSFVIIWIRFRCARDQKEARQITSPARNYMLTKIRFLSGSSWWETRRFAPAKLHQA